MTTILLALLVYLDTKHFRAKGVRILPSIATSLIFVGLFVLNSAFGGYGGYYQTSYSSPFYYTFGYYGVYLPLTAILIICFLVRQFWLVPESRKGLPPLPPESGWMKVVLIVVLLLYSVSGYLAYFLW